MLFFLPLSLFSLRGIEKTKRKYFFVFSFYLSLLLSFFYMREIANKENSKIILCIFSEIIHCICNNKKGMIQCCLQTWLQNDTRNQGKYLSCLWTFKIWEYKREEIIENTYEASIEHWPRKFWKSDWSRFTKWRKG